MKDDFGFEIPVELVPLPSGGRVYPVETGLHNVKQVETDLAQMKANLNAINGALQQMDKLIGMAGGKPVKKEDDKKV